jgi:hypothetical protein
MLGVSFLVYLKNLALRYECYAFKVFVRKALNRPNNKRISRRSLLEKYKDYNFIIKILRNVIPVVRVEII